ncbi:MAG: porin, partial [Planctomycetia bacterium]
KKAGGSAEDRISAVEKALGKLVAAGDKKKADDAKKPSLTVSGQVQADQVYFGQGPVSRASVGDLQDGTQFRRLRIGARGTSFEVLEYSLGVDFALANQPSYLDNYLEWKQLPWLQNIRAGHYFEPFSLERVTQNRNNTFMERSLVDTFAPEKAGEKGGDKGGEKAGDKGEKTLADRLSTVEKGLGKLVDAGDKKKKEDAKKPSLVVSGQVQADTVYFGQDAISRKAVGDLQDGAQFRRLRIGARRTSFEVLEYALGVDFALANQPSYLDNYLEWKQLPWLQNVRAGHYFEPFSLERVTQNRNNTFMERSLVDTFAPARNMGVMTYGNTENELATWAIGTFRT